MLVDNYYTVLEQKGLSPEATFSVALHADSPVYEGHFPGEPISPGVCSLQLVKECAERLCGRRLLVRSMPQCRFLHLIKPSLCPIVAVCVRIVSESDKHVLFRAELLHNDVRMLTVQAECEYV